MFHFGFSYIGLIWLLMLFVPNFIWTQNKPVGYDEAPAENKVFLFLERLGQALVSALVLIFKDFNIDLNRKSALVVLTISFLLMVCYELYWIRYFKSAKTMEDFYASFLGIPVAGATYPVLAFFVLALYGANSFLMISVIILGIGHIGIHIQHRNAVIAKKTRKLPIRILKIMGAVLGSIFVLFATTYFGIRNILFIKAFAGAKNPVNEELYIDLNGQEQFIRVMGRNADNPVIIILHGGPGSPDGMLDYAYMDYILDDYTYITWDQRGCGRTYYKNHKTDPANQTATENQLLDDVDGLVGYAMDRFGRDKVVILGHSWGSRLAIRYSLLHPEKIDKTICIGQLVNFHKGEELSYKHALSLARAKGDNATQMIQAMKTLKNDPSLLNVLNLRSYTAIYNAPKITEKTFLRGATSPYLGIDDIRWLFTGLTSGEKLYKSYSVLWDYLFKTAEGGAGIDSYGTEFEIPVYFISGEMDFTCPTQLAKEYCNLITAKDKAFFEIEGCGHSPQEDKPEEVANIIKNL